MSKMIWAKKQSTTDALQPTTGQIVKHLRLTQSENRYNDEPIPIRTFFYDSFFDCCDWSRANSPNFSSPGKKAMVDFEVFVFGRDLGTNPLEVNHFTERHDNNSAPATHILYNQAITKRLQGNGNPQNWVVVIRQSDDTFNLVIT